MRRNPFCGRSCSWINVCVGQVKNSSHGRDVAYLARVSLLAVLCGACGGGSGASAPSGVEWATYGQNQLRTSFNSSETKITTANVGSLQFKWRYLTDAIVSASPTVAYINVPGEGNEKIVFIESWDGNFYALRASNGSRLWNARLKPQPGASYPYASSATVATVAGEQRVYVGGGMTMYSFVAATGEERWEFDAGTGCTSCDPMTERNEIESSPAVVGSLAAAFVEGLQTTGIAATAKHFPGLGTATVNTDDRAVTIRAAPGLLQRGLDPFRSAIEAGVKLVMVSTAAYPSLDPSGKAAVFSQPIVTGLLRGTLGFEGVVVSDALDAPGAVHVPHATTLAIEAGVDVLLYTSDLVSRQGYASLLVDAAGSATLRAELARAGARIRALKAWLTAAGGPSCPG